MGLIIFCPEPAEGALPRIDFFGEEEDGCFLGDLRGVSQIDSEVGGLSSRDVSFAGVKLEVEERHANCSSGWFWDTADC